MNVEQTNVDSSSSIELGIGRRKTSSQKRNASEEDGADDEIIVEESGGFPSLFQHLPRFHLVGVETSSVTREPVSVSLYKPKYRGKWLLVLSLPGLDFPYGPASVKQVFKKIEAFKGLNCWVFILSLDPWSKLRTFRDSLESIVVEQERPFDVSNVTFLSDPQATVSKRVFDVLCCANNHQDSYQGPKMNYPGYFLLTPDKELVQSCVIKDPNKLWEKTDKTFFGYPYTFQVIDSIADCLATLQPVQLAVESLKADYPQATFGTFMEDMIHRVKTEGKDKRWGGWAKAAEGVFRGGVQ